MSVGNKKNMDPRWLKLATEDPAVPKGTPFQHIVRYKACISQITPKYIIGVKRFGSEALKVRPHPSILQPMSA